MLKTLEYGINFMLFYELMILYCIYNFLELDSIQKCDQDSLSRTQILRRKS